MGLGDRSWMDRFENYADSYSIAVVGTTATAFLASAAGEMSRPAVVYSITVSVNPGVASGEVSLVDSSATADAGTVKHRIRVASGTSAFHQTDQFPRGIAFDNGIVVSALTVSGSINLSYKARF